MRPARFEPARRSVRPGPKFAWAGIRGAWGSRSWLTVLPSSSSTGIGPRVSPSPSSGWTPVTRATSAGPRGSVTASWPSFELAKCAGQLDVEAAATADRAATAEPPLCRPDVSSARAELSRKPAGCSSCSCRRRP